MVAERTDTMRVSLGNILTTSEGASRSTYNIAQAGMLLDIAPAKIQLLIDPQDVHLFRLHTDIAGVPLSVWGCLSLHNRARGIYKGGIRLSPDVNIDETIELSRLMTLKTALAELELGGGKTGLKCDIKRLYPQFGKQGYDRDFERHVKHCIMAEFAHHYRGMLEKRRYVPAPDLGTGPDEMVTIYNETHEPSSVTGKPEGVCGWLPGRTEATGFGVYIIIRQLLLQLGKHPEEVRIAIHGFGNVGANTAIFLHQLGVKVTAIVDAEGGITDPTGIDIPQLIEHTRRHGTVRGFGQAITASAFFALDVDVLVPAAINDAITVEVAEVIKARYIVEGANFPTTLEAVQILEKRGITVVPDIIANAGGVIASAEEFVHAVSTTKLTKEHVYAIIERKITENYHQAVAIARERQITLDLACTLLAVQRVYGTMRRLGWV